MSQNVWVADGTAARRSRISASSASRSCSASLRSTDFRNSAATGAPARARLGELMLRHRLQREGRVGVDAEAGMVGFEHSRLGIDLDEPAPRSRT